MSDKMKIKHIEGGSHGDRLKGCYFVPAGGFLKKFSR